MPFFDKKQDVLDIQLTPYGRHLLSKGKLEDAKIVFESILKVQPNHYKALTNIGAIYLSLDKLIKAEEKFKRAICRSPYKPWYYIS